MSTETALAAAPAPAAPPLRSTAGQAPFPDALRLPAGWKGSNQSPFRRVATLFDLAEPLLGVRVGGAAASQQSNYYFVRPKAKGPQPTMHFADGHPTFAKQPRYEWEARPDVGPDVFFGWLTDDAKSELGEAAGAKA